MGVVTQIEPAAPDDVPYIAGVMAQRWNLQQQEAVSDSRKYVAKADGRAAFIARLRGKPIGCGLYDPRNDEVSTSYGPWLLLLWVEPSYRRRGVGWRLSLARFQFARQSGVNAVFLDTSNAKRYHLNRGWVEVATASYHGEPVSILRYDTHV
jgi:predicted N-acetyltransferase YhbS